MQVLVDPNTHLLKDITQNNKQSKRFDRNRNILTEESYIEAKEAVVDKVRTFLKEFPDMVSRKKRCKVDPQQA